MAFSSFRLVAHSTANQARRRFILRRHVGCRGTTSRVIKRQIGFKTRQSNDNGFNDQIALSSIFVVGCAAASAKERSTCTEVQRLGPENSQAQRGGHPETLATSPTSSNLDLEKLQADWDEFHLESLRYNDDDDDDDDEDDEDDEDDDDAVDSIKEEGAEGNDGGENGDKEIGIKTEERSEDAQNGEQESVDEELDKNLYPDDFSDLPEKDEDTTCSICLINRQGPCRNPWRRFEKCIKANPLDHEDENEPDDTKEDSTSPDHVQRKCDHLFKPWFICFSQHRVTYSMITNRQMQEETDFLEEANGTEAMPIDLRAKLDEDDVQEMQMEPSLEKPYIQRYIKYPLSNPKTNNPIRVAYVRDEEGKILGFDHFKKELEDGEVEGDMMFHVPADATFVTAYSFYAPPPAPVEAFSPSQSSEESHDGTAKDAEPNKIDTPDAEKEELDAPFNNEKVFYQHIVIDAAPKSIEGKEESGHSETKDEAKN